MPYHESRVLLHSGNTHKDMLELSCCKDIMKYLYLMGSKTTLLAISSVVFRFDLAFRVSSVGGTGARMT